MDPKDLANSMLAEAGMIGPQVSVAIATNYDAILTVPNLLASKNKLNANPQGATSNDTDRKMAGPPPKRAKTIEPIESTIKFSDYVLVARTNLAKDDDWSVIAPSACYGAHAKRVYKKAKCLVWIGNVGSQAETHMLKMCQLWKLYGARKIAFFSSEPGQTLRTVLNMNGFQVEILTLAHDQLKLIKMTTDCDNSSKSIKSAPKPTEPKAKESEIETTERADEQLVYSSAESSPVI